jgi:phosphatidylglycerol:prolipoprotein diacylglycerol transferase
VTIPYFTLPNLQLPFNQKIDVFGVLSAAGVFLGAWLAAKEARDYAKLDDKPLRDLVPWAVGFGLFGGHFLHIFGYHRELLTDFWVVLRFWDGLSSMGGVLGALVGIFVFFRKEKIPLLPYVDSIALGTAPGWSVARIGCFLVHDHPGVRTDFPLAVDFPVLGYGGPRHDLGLYDVFVLAAIGVLLHTLKRRRPPQGTLMGLLACCYCLPRFLLDFLRASDLGFVDRKEGLTAAQYIVPVLFGVGVWLLLQARKNPVAPASPLTPKR